MPVLSLCLSVVSLSFSCAALWVLLELAEHRRSRCLDEVPQHVADRIAVEVEQLERTRRNRELALGRLCRLSHALQPFGLLTMAGGGIDQ